MFFVETFRNKKERKPEQGDIFNQSSRRSDVGELLSRRKLENDAVDFRY